MEDESGWSKVVKKKGKPVFLPGHNLKMFESNLFNFLLKEEGLVSWFGRRETLETTDHQLEQHESKLWSEGKEFHFIAVASQSVLKW